MCELSVLLPIYNNGDFLKPAIDSIKNQSFSDFECLLLDASTDGSSDFLSAFCDQDHRFIHVKQPGMRLAESLAWGVKHAKAPLLARMDADDIALTKRFEIQFGIMKTRPDLALLGTAVRYMDENSGLHSKKRFPLKPDLPESLLWGCPFCHPSVFLRKEAVLKAGNYRPQFTRAEDYDLWLRLQQHGKLENLPDILLHYRVHSHNASLVNAAQSRAFAMSAQALWWLTTHAHGAHTDAAIAPEEALTHLPENEKFAVIMRMLACSASALGDEKDDREALALINQAKKFHHKDIPAAIALWHLGCANKYFLKDRKRAFSHIGAALKQAPLTAIKGAAEYLRSHYS